MIPLQDVIDDLTYGELSQLSISGEINGATGVAPADYAIIIRHINLCLDDMFSRFQIKQEALILRQFADVTRYILNSKYSVSEDDATVPEKWIIDTVDLPFEDDIIKIIGIYDADNILVPLNDRNNADSIYTSNYDEVLISSPVAGTDYTIHYQASHPVIDTEVLGIENIVLEIPSTLREPLLWYVASRMFGSLIGQEDRAMSAEYFQRYEGRMLKLEQDGIFSQTEEESDSRFYLRGWI